MAVMVTWAEIVSTAARRAARGLNQIDKFAVRGLEPRQLPLVLLRALLFGTKSLLFIPLFSCLLRSPFQLFHQRGGLGLLLYRGDPGFLRQPAALRGLNPVFPKYDLKAQGGHREYADAMGSCAP
jgi:hypothetical protein